MTVELDDAQVDALLAILSELEPAHAALLGKGLVVGRHPSSDCMASFGELLRSLEWGRVDQLTRLQARRWLRLLAAPHNAETRLTLLEQIDEHTTTEPWRTLRACALWADAVDNSPAPPSA